MRAPDVLSSYSRRSLQALRQFSDALNYLRNAVHQSPTVRGLCLLAETQVAIGSTPGVDIALRKTSSSCSRTGDRAGALDTCNKGKDLLSTQNVNSIAGPRGGSISVANRRRLLCRRCVSLPRRGGCAGGSNRRVVCFICSHVLLSKVLNTLGKCVARPVRMVCRSCGPDPPCACQVC